MPVKDAVQEKMSKLAAGLTRWSWLHMSRGQHAGPRIFAQVPVPIMGQYFGFDVGRAHTSHKMCLFEAVSAAAPVSDIALVRSPNKASLAEDRPSLILKCASAGISLSIRLAVYPTSQSSLMPNFDFRCGSVLEVRVYTATMVSNLTTITNGFCLRQSLPSAPVQQLRLSIWMCYSTHRL